MYSHASIPYHVFLVSQPPQITHFSHCILILFSLFLTMVSSFKLCLFPNFDFVESELMFFQSGNLTICGIPEDLKAVLRTFRFAKVSLSFLSLSQSPILLLQSSCMNAIILKIDRDAQEMRIDEELNVS